MMNFTWYQPHEMELFSPKHLWNQADLTNLENDQLNRLCLCVCVLCKDFVLLSNYSDILQVVVAPSLYHLNIH